MKRIDLTTHQEKWQNLIDEYKKSGLTQKAFCEHHNLSISQFGYNYSKIKGDREPTIPKARFSPVKIVNHDKTVGTADIKISLPNGFQCAFPLQIEMIQIKKVVEVLLSC